MLAFAWATFLAHIACALRADSQSSDGILHLGREEQRMFKGLIEDHLGVAMCWSQVSQRDVTQAYAYEPRSMHFPKCNIV